MSGRVIFREKYGSTSIERDYVKSDSGRIQVIQANEERSVSAGHYFRSVFLPQGYPESVSDDYMMYQVYDTIQAFASSITGTLATQALLKGVGVGDESATALAATITWLYKDGTGMLGRIMFAWVQGSSLDCDAKRWRLFADMLNDFAICLEITAPIFPMWFTFIVCIAGVCKSIVGVAGGSSRAALTLHQARRNNMADVSAKDGSQETLVNLAALLCSIILMPIVANHDTLIWTLFFIFTFVHLWANYSAVKSVIMESLNQARFHILVSDFFSFNETSLPSIKDTNLREPVIIKTRWLYDIKVGSELKLISDNSSILDSLTDLYNDEKFLLGINLKMRQIHIILRTDSDTTDQLIAAFQAEIINVLAQRNLYGRQSGNDGSRLSQALIQENAINEILMSSFNTAINEGDAFEISRTSRELTKNIFPAFYSEIKRSGWITSHVLFGTDEWRATWGSVPMSDKVD